MAFITKEKKKKQVTWCVRYDYYTQNPENPYEPLRKHAKKTFTDEKEALSFKLKVEHEKLNNQFLAPSRKTLEEFGYEWLRIYGQRKKWQPSTFDGNKRMLEKHIFPVLGNRKMQEISPQDIDMFFNEFQYKKVDKPQFRGMPESRIPCLSTKTQREIFNTMRTMFMSAVTWRLIDISPVRGQAPEKGKPKRVIWDKHMMKEALDCITDPILYLAVHLAFACTLRTGETVGVCLDDIDLEKGQIHICRTLQRVSKEALNAMKPKEIYHVFPSRTKNAKSVLVLKKCKTEMSNRRIAIPENLKPDLLKRMEEVERQKAFYGGKYHDQDLLFCRETGEPIEPNRLQEMFRDWQQESGLNLPHAMFKGIRGSSITFKLKAGKGDVKSVQGDSGHATASMVLDTYGQTNDADRAEMFEAFSKAFYSDSGDVGDNMDSFVEALQNNPKMRDKLLLALVANNA